MKMKFKWSLIVLMGLFFSCNKEEDLTSDGLSAPKLNLVTSSALKPYHDLIVGVNGHPFSRAAYTNVPAAQQGQWLKELGIDYYGVDLTTDTYGTVPDAKLVNNLGAVAAKRGFNLVATVYIKTLSYSVDEKTSYDNGKLLGSGFAGQYGSYFDTYCLGSQQENALLKPGAIGNSDADYDPAKLKILAAYLRGMNEGIKSKDAGAQTIINANWLHFNYFKLLETQGVQYDIVGYTWDSNMDGNAKKNYKITSIASKLASITKKPIWFTSVTYTKNASESEQNAWLIDFTNECRRVPSVEAMFINALVDEPTLPGVDKFQGIIKFTANYNKWQYKTYAKNLLTKRRFLKTGSNGHPMDAAPSPYESIPLNQQMTLLKDMGLTDYRFGLGVRADGTAPAIWRLREVLKVAAAHKIELLPIISPTSLNYNLSDTQNYNLGKTLGAGVSKNYGQHFDFYELGNELENHIMVSGTSGIDPSHYNEKKVASIAAFLRGMNEGIKLNDPTAKTMVNASWLHFGYMQMLQKAGVKFDIVSWHWYSDMEGAAASKYYRIPDITQKLSSLFPGMPIWFSEVNQKRGSINSTEEEQRTFITDFTNKCRNNAAVKAIFYYELFNEPDKPDPAERDYGMIKWNSPYSSWSYKLAANDLSAQNK